MQTLTLMLASLVIKKARIQFKTQTSSQTHRYELNQLFIVLQTTLWVVVRGY
jgi:hypothetical protein